MTKSAEEVAAGLSRPQREVLLADPTGEFAVSQNWAVSMAIHRRGLTNWLGYVAPLSPLGLEVRALLLPTQNKEAQP